MSALPILTILKNGETIRSQNVESDLVIGRGDGCVIRLDDRAVSRQHATLKPTADGVQIERKSEFAPLSVNGAECTRALLKEGDIIEIGPYLMKLSMKMIEKVASAPEQPIAKMAAQIVAFPREEAPRDAAPILEMPPREEDISHSILSEVDPTADPIPEPPTSEMFGESPFSPSLPESIDPPTNLMASIPEETVITTEVGADVGLLSLDGEGLSGASEPETGQASAGGLATPIDPTMAEDDGSDKTSVIDTHAPESPGMGGEAFNLGDGIFDSIESGGQPLEMQNSGPMEVDGTAAIHTSAMEIAPQAGENDATQLQNRSFDAKIILTSGTANTKSFDLTSGEISIGRGKNCNIVIDDKKSSRKNAVIVKEGNRWILRDLDSANGTYVNGTQVKEHVLEADDVIQIGATELQFQATNPLYAKQKKNFLTVPNEPTSFNQSMASPLTPDMSAMQGFGEAAAIPGGIPQPAAPKKGLFGIYDRYIRNFSSLKPIQKGLVILVIGFGAMTFLEEEEVAKKPATAKTAPGATGSAKTGVLSFDSLSPQQKEFVTNQYQLALEFYTKKDYNQAIYEIGKIYPILPDYEKAKELERYAVEGKKKLVAIEEERLKKEEESRLKARIAEYIEKSRGFMALKKYDPAKELFSEILSIEPDNAEVAGWQREIDAYYEKKQLEEQERLVQEEINKRAWDQYNDAFELQKAAKYHDAIDAYGKVADMGSSDKRLLAKVKTMIQTSQESIRDLRGPVIAKGKEFEESGDLGAAFKEYEKATKIDPPHPAGYAGMDRIRDVLTDRAKVLYTEAVIAESYSDFNSAYKKYKEILNMAPDGSLYHQRATRKLAGYFNFKPTEEAAH